jgi:AraC-like DNA-binding protein
MGKREISCNSALLGFRRIARNTDEHTAIACIFPWGAASYGWILSLGPDPKSLLILCGIYNSFIFDYLLRNSLSQPSIPQGTFQQIAIIPAKSIDIFWNELISSAVLELSYTAWNLEEFAKDCGYNNPPFRWDEERRFRIRCELDAAFFHLYGVVQGDVDYIMETFPIVKRKDERRYGSYRTKELIIDIFNRMQLALEHSEAYISILDPFLGDIKCSHTPK